MKEREEALARENLEHLKGLERDIENLETIRAIKEDEEAVIRTIFKWKAPDRIFVPKGRNFFATIAVVFVVGIVISAIMESIMFIFVLVSLLALLFIQHTIAPLEVEHEITNKGIKAFKRIYLWKDIEKFWVTRRVGHNLLHVDFTGKFGDRLIILINDEDELKIVRELLKHIPYADTDETNFIAKFTEGEFIPMISYFKVEEATPKATPVTKAATK